MGSRRALTFTVCVRDDDAKLFEFRVTSDTVAVKELVKAAVRRGRTERPLRPRALTVFAVGGLLIRWRSIP